VAGRPPYSPTSETRKWVFEVTVAGASARAIARALGIADHTVGKHFAGELAAAAEARMLAEAKARAENFRLLLKAARRGKVSAMIAIDRHLDRLEAEMEAAARIASTKTAT
jgi:hypothetical protein